MFVIGFRRKVAIVKTFVANLVANRNLEELSEREKGTFEAKKW